MADHNADNSTKTICNNDKWYFFIFTFVILTYLIIFFLIYDIFIVKNIIVSNEVYNFYTVTIFSSLGGLTMIRSFLRDSWNNPNVTAHCMDFIGYFTRLLCAISVGIITYFALKSFGHLILAVEVKSINSQALAVISFVSGYYSEDIIIKLKKLIEKEDENK